MHLLHPPPPGFWYTSFFFLAGPGATYTKSQFQRFREVNCAVLIRGGGGGVLIFMHGPSRMTIDPRTPTMPGRGRSTSSFYRPGSMTGGGKKGELTIDPNNDARR